MNPSEKNRRGTLYQMILCALFAALIAVGAFIKVPLPTIPFTLQTFFVMLAGMLLGPKWGGLSAVVYLAVGLAGIPVFTQGGGLGYIFQPSFGYIVGFCFGAALTGWIARRKEKPSFWRLMASGFAGLGVIYVMGLIHYWVISTYYVGTGIGLWPLFLYGFLRTISGDIALCILASVLAGRLIPVLAKKRA